MPPSTRKLPWRRALLVVGIGALAAVTYHYIDRRLPYYHFRTVQEGVFYRSSQLTGEELEEAIEDYGFRTIVNLRTVAERERGDWYEREKEVAAKRNVRFVDVPMRGDEPPHPDQLPLLYSVFDDPAAQPVLVHCEKGSIRSAAVEGFYRREYLREAGDEALGNVESWSHDLEETYPKITRFILEYVPRKRSP